MWKCLGVGPGLRTTALAHPGRPPILSSRQLYQCISLFNQQPLQTKSSAVGLRRTKKVMKPRVIQKHQFPKRPKTRVLSLPTPLRSLSHLMTPTMATDGHLQELLHRLLPKSKGGLRVTPYSHLSLYMSTQTVELSNNLDYLDYSSLIYRKEYGRL